MFPLNRIGGLRGTEAATIAAVIARLDTIATKLDALLAATPPAVNLTALETAIGSLADCTTGQSVIGLLCSLNESVGGVEGGAGPPPASCPLFPEFPTDWAVGFNWTDDTIAPPPSSGAWKLTLTEQGGQTSVYVDTVTPYPSDPGYTLSVLKTTVNAANVCISWSLADTGYQVKSYLVNSATHATISVDPLWSDETETGIGSTTRLLDTGQYIYLRASSVGGAIPAPAATLWVVQGPFG